MAANKLTKIIGLLAEYGRTIKETASLPTLAGASEAANTRRDDKASPNRIITPEGA